MKKAKENLDIYIRSLPFLGLIISCFSLILFFFILKADGDFFVIFAYCLVPLFVNTSVYAVYMLFKKNL
ncbi:MULTISPECIES: hypothetical protein [Staphylococcus]|uniref:Doubtful CDS n=1 Tax=Staphylococcus schleiferi TaxID=1295 RepID=A0A7Z7QNR8_STASC|nr:MULTISPECIES: hypothetical protein [Staphylococcus]QGS45824.1 hypothetical protein FOB90_03600 [Mammaliicoccus fleurettii]EPD50424.1 hypothetical protein HMPREF1208_01303 [Staphylococcus sp. HGB0015]MBF1992354.1 hypothetical protein [Staphylococcus schleiferi]MBF2038048.1 hypothetical protein [Staphylococcus schleiferi]MBF2099852.1 hypothetical protein [Staphylococcus schleiferi]